MHCKGVHTNTHSNVTQKQTALVHTETSIERMAASDGKAGRAAWHRASPPTHEAIRQTVETPKAAAISEGVATDPTTAPPAPLQRAAHPSQSRQAVAPPERAHPVVPAVLMAAARAADVDRPPRVGSLAVAAVPRPLDAPSKGDPLALAVDAIIAAAGGRGRGRNYDHQGCHQHQEGKRKSHMGGRAAGALAGGGGWQHCSSQNRKSQIKSEQG